MRVIYEANDGTQFDDQYACLDYEFSRANPTSAIFYDAEGDILENQLAEETYYDVMTIVVPTKEDVDYMQRLGAYTGYCGYEDIVQPGTWAFNDDGKAYLKKEV